jgi:hypothetical protein
MSLSSFRLTISDIIINFPYILGDMTDRIINHNVSVDHIIPFTVVENRQDVLITSSGDGILRLLRVFPHEVLCNARNLHKNIQSNLPFFKVLSGRTTHAMNPLKHYL